MKRLSFTEIAKASQVTPQFISQIMSGQKRPSWKKAKEIARATCTNPELWLDGTPEQIKAAVLGVKEGRASIASE